MPTSSENAWFRRRTFGRGWSLHKTWQGWLLILADLALATVAVAWWQDDARALSTVLAALALLTLLLCWWKGERSLWRGNALARLTAKSGR